MSTQRRIEDASDEQSHDSRLPELLAEFDEALKGSPADSATTRVAGPHSADDAELRRAMACVRLLEDVFPRRAGRDSRPASLGRFQIVRKLGHGGFGVVYLARDPQLGREVALKVPHGHMLTDEQTLERFRREAQAAAALDHPNLVPVYEAGEAGGVNYIAMAYCPGTSLAHWLSARPHVVCAREAGMLIATVAKAVHYAHERGIVHRDLKPANIMLVDRRGPAGFDAAPPDSDSLANYHPKVTDFGLAKYLGGESPMTQTGTMAGTPNYMAPEQAGERGGSVGPATDVYALGAILYELLTGRAPFRGNSALETLHQVRFAEPVPPSRLRSRLSRDVETICLKCLEKDPRRRYGSAAELAADLDAYLDGRPIHARPITRIHRVVRWCARKPVVASLAAALLLAVLGAGALVVWHRHDQELGQRRISQASAEASQAWQVAEENFAKAVQAGAKADVRYEQNRAAVERLAEVSNDLLRRPRLDAAGRAVLEELLGSYQRFAQEKGDDPAVRLRSARALLRVANLCGALGQYDKTDDALRQAGDVLQRLVDTNPADAQSRRELVNYHLQKAHYDRRKGGKAAIAGSVHDYERALAGIEQLLESAPGNVSDHITRRNVLDNLGRTFILLNEVDRAEAAFRKAMEIQRRLLAGAPTSPSLRAALAGSFEALSQVEHSRRRWDQAQDWCRQALAILEDLAKERPSGTSHQFDLAWTHGRMAEICRARGDAEKTEVHVTEAVRLLEKLHSDSPSDHRTAGMLARFLELECQHYRGNGKLSEAAAAIDKAVTIRGGLVTPPGPDPVYVRELAASCYLQGCVYREKKDYRAAITALSRVIPMNELLPEYFPQEPTFRNEVAWRSRDIANQFRQMRAPVEAQIAYRQALNHFTKLAAANPDDPDPARQQATTRHLLGGLYLDARNFDAARDAFEHAIAIRQRLAAANKPLPEDLLELSRHRRALSDTLIHQGRALWAKGDEGRAESSFREAHRAAEDHPAALQALAWFLTTCADENLRGSAEALDLAKRGVEAAPKAAHMHSALAAAHYRKQEYAAAIAAIDAAIAVRGGGRAEDWFIRAMARRRLDETQAARSDYDQALNWMQNNAPNDTQLKRLRAEAEALLGTPK